MFYKQNEYIDSKNIEVQKTLRSECNRFTVIAKKYLPNCQEIYSNLISKVVRKEYSTGGELITRGYYCPSPIYDIVVGNCKRGKLLKKVTSRSKPTYEYCFDKNDKLIIVNYLYSNFTEILEYNNDTVLGITFSTGLKSEIISVTECKYDRHGRIISFVNADSCYNNCNIDNLKKEYYFYNDSGLCKAEDFDYLDNSHSGILNYYRYIFEHDDEGYLKEYKVEPSMFENDVYKVFIKRKI